MRALGYVSPFSVEGHERCEAIGICGEEYPMRLLSEFSCLSGLTAFLLPSHSRPLPLPSPSTTSSSCLSGPPFVATPSAIQRGRCSLLDDFVWQTVKRRGCVEDEGRLFDAGPSRLCRRRGVVHGAAPLSMGSLRHGVACPRCAVETRCVAKRRRENDCATAITITTTETRLRKREDGRIRKRER